MFRKGGSIAYTKYCKQMHIPVAIIIVIITLFQEDNMFVRVACLTYGPQLTNVGIIL